MTVQGRGLAPDGHAAIPVGIAKIEQLKDIYALTLTAADAHTLDDR